MKIYTYWRSLATFRVRIALNLKGLQAEPVYVDLMAGNQKKPEYKAVNPQMAIPALVDDDGTVLTQSLAIMEYLEEKFPKPALMPADPRGRARVRMLALITVADSHPLVVPRVREHLGATFGAGEEQKVAWGRHWLEAGLDAYEAHLARDKATGTYAHGNQVSIADICLVSHGVGAQLFGGTLDRHPTVKRIFDHCMTDDRFAKAHPKRQPGAPA